VFIPPRILEEVGFLSADFVNKGVKKRYEVGTCFFVTLEDHARSVGFGYLVTAKHVWEQLKHAKPAYVRLNKHTVTAGQSGVTYLKLPNDWYFHDDPSVDLAVLPWGSIQNNYVCTSFSFDEILTTPEFLKKHGAAWPPGVGRAGRIHRANDAARWV
jgi:hypothetical protein